MSNAHCRSCGGTDLKTVLDLGQTPLVNRLLTAELLHQPEPTYPLELAFCPSCTLLQVKVSVPPEELFRDYVYFSSFSDTMLNHVRELVTGLIAKRKLGPKSKVLEAASNDGYLLQFYKQAGIPVLGIEPARNIACVAREQKNIPTIDEFFGEDLGRQLRARGELADVFHAHNVLAHVPEPNSFVQGIRQVLKDNGVALIEVPYVKDTIEQCEFDQMYHEHLFYYSLTALNHLFVRQGLEIQDVERQPIHGGSLRLYVGHPGPGCGVSARVISLLRREKESGMGRLEYYLDFAGRVQQLKASICEHLRDLKKKGHRLAAYGASGKGTMLLNYFGVGRETLDFVVDRNPVKQGKFTPGTYVPIVAPEKLLEQQPDYVLLLTWNIADEVLAQQAEYRRRGGKFITPIPELKVA